MNSAQDSHTIYKMDCFVEYASQAAREKGIDDL
jgi:hypothetical protein